MKATALRRLVSIAALGLALGGLSLAGEAQAVTFNLDHEFSGGTNPSGKAPWLRATFTDTAGGVLLTMDNLLQGSTEFADAWYFNLDTELNPSSLTFTYVSGQQTAGAPLHATDSFKADGDGWFDVKFAWTTQNNADRFTQGEQSVFLISGISGLTASEFWYSSLPGGGNGTWDTAAHVQGISPNDSGWIGYKGTPQTVPEPGTILLLGGGLLGLAGFGIRRKRA